MNEYVIVSEDINEYFENYLRECGLIVVKVRKNKNLYTAISSHPDIVLSLIDKTIVIEASTYDYLLEYLEESDYQIIKTEPILSGKYPSDIKLNLAYTGKYAMHNFKHTDNKLLKLLESTIVYENNEETIVECININQGYSKCSILIVDSDSIITSDKGIYNSLKDSINCLLIEKGHIKLKGLEYGFIGGASGRYKNQICFYGDVSKHPSFVEIKRFIEERALKLMYFTEFELEDIGSIFFL